MTNDFPDVEVHGRRAPGGPGGPGHAAVHQLLGHGRRQPEPAGRARPRRVPDVDRPAAGLLGGVRRRCRRSSRPPTQWSERQPRPRPRSWRAPTTRSARRTRTGAADVIADFNAQLEALKTGDPQADPRLGPGEPRGRGRRLTMTDRVNDPSPRRILRDPARRGARRMALHGSRDHHPRRLPLHPGAHGAVGELLGLDRPRQPVLVERRTSSGCENYAAVTTGGGLADAQLRHRAAQQRLVRRCSSCRCRRRCRSSSRCSSTARSCAGAGSSAPRSTSRP